MVCTINGMLLAATSNAKITQLHCMVTSAASAMQAARHMTLAAHKA